MQTAFAKFMAKVPAEYLPKLDEVLKDAVRVVLDPNSTAAQYDAVGNELQNLLGTMKLDSAEATADAWQEVLEEKLKVQWATRLIGEGMDPKQASKEAAKLVGPKINDLLKRVEFLQEVIQSRYFKPAARWGWLKFTAMLAGAIGLLSFAIYTGREQGNAASDFGTESARRSAEASEAEDFWARQREYEAAMNSIKLADDAFDGLALTIAPSYVVSGPQAPPRLQSSGPSVVAIPPSVASQPLSVTITRPNQETLHTETTVGAFISAMPSPQREQATKVVTKIAEDAANTTAPVMASPARIQERHFTVEARDGHGTIFGSYSQ